MGWIESGWRQFTPAGRPLVSFDFGYGVMQITSGMAGAFGNGTGSIDAKTQSRIASDYLFNIGFGAKILIGKWTDVPQIGDGDPTTVENWYYALWAYNGWGWVNNPNNPRFTRQGTPATNPSTYPYQERVLYLVAHPPHDSDGNPLWQPVPVWMPKRSLIGNTPHTYIPAKVHHQAPPSYNASFTVPDLAPATASASQSVAVRVQNTGTAAWAATSSTAISLTYHLFTSTGDPWGTFSPFTPGVVALGQGTIPLPHDVLPGHRVTLHALVQAPSNAGSYLVAWDLQEAPALWLSQTGLMPHAQKLRVVPPGKLSTIAATTPTPLPLPVEGAQYVADTAVPDGSTVQAKQPFQKSWLVFNNGKVPWSSGWTLRHQTGATFSAKVIPVPTLAPCRSVNLFASMKAPSKAGTYTGVWRLHDAAGVSVGDKLTVVIKVKGPAPVRTPLPTVTPTESPSVRRPTPVPSLTPSGLRSRWQSSR